MRERTKPKTNATARRTRFKSSAGIIVRRDPVANQVGGHLALDFCNTAGEHLAEQPDELLRDWDSFLRWATQVALIGSKSYARLLRHPEPIASIVRLREAIYRVGLSIAGARRVSRRDLACIRKHADRRRPEFEFRKNAIRWRPAPAHASAQLCAVLASDALSLLCSPRALRIRICEGGKCGWLFLDESRGKKRRWCDMNDCGNREKARRYYEKQKNS
jgi:predicted RNA-binding Zn ribbon-like protein